VAQSLKIAGRRVGGDPSPGAGGPDASDGREEPAEAVPDRRRAAHRCPHLRPPDRYCGSSRIDRTRSTG